MKIVTREASQEEEQTHGNPFERIRHTGLGVGRLARTPTIERQTQRDFYCSNARLIGFGESGNVWPFLPG